MHEGICSKAFECNAKMKISCTERKDRSIAVELLLTINIKGELYVDKKWQSDYLFYIIMNKSRPRVDQF